MNNAPHTFFTLLQFSEQSSGVIRLIESIRAFGGDFRTAPIWVFDATPQQFGIGRLKRAEVEVIPLSIPESVQRNYFAGKVLAAAQAESTATPGDSTLIWMSSDSLIFQPPLGFDLDGKYDIALRPVHIRNIGLRVDEPLNEFWKTIYAAVGLDDVDVQIDSFVDGQRLRAYFNSHSYAIHPGLGLLREWYAIFEKLVCDEIFQQGVCKEPRYQIFLHQAVFSALIIKMIETPRIRLLPPEYSYPYHLHSQIPAAQRAQRFNDLVCIAYEDQSLNPTDLTNIAVEEPLKSWLEGYH